jgi:actin-related protein 6
VRKWLKPLSTTSSLNTLVGRPWEILYVTDLLPPKYAHTVDIYAKSGGAMGYMAQVAAVNQYGVGVIVLTAGPVNTIDILYRALLGTFVPAIEEEARFQSNRFAGTWTSKTSPPSNESQKRSNEKIKLTLDIDDGTGIKLASFTRGDASIVDAIKRYGTLNTLPSGLVLCLTHSVSIPQVLKIPVPASEVESLLAQSDSHSHLHHSRSYDDEDKVRVERQEWRINLDIIPLNGAAMSDLPGQTTATQYCGLWQTVDWMMYGGISLDKVVFVVDKVSGVVPGVEVPALRAGLLTRH